MKRFHIFIITALDIPKGEALQIGMKHGAGYGYLDSYQGHAAISSHAKTLVGWTTIMQGGFIVNSSGERFGDESAGYSEYAAILNDQKGNTGWIIIDNAIHEGSMLFKEYEYTAASGAIVWADSIEELATAIAVPADKLKAELEMHMQSMTVRVKIDLVARLLKKDCRHHLAQSKFAQHFSILKAACK
jgi:succinate dehydrogenase/fumarate reductase flavoprotein subunit